MRDDLASAHARARDHLVSPGSWWRGRERRAFAEAALAAWDDPAPPPPWVADPITRMTRHAATLTEDWYRETLAARGWSELAYVELCGVVSTTVALAAFAEAAGVARTELPPAVEGEPSGEAPEVERARLNWVPVARPADRTAAVVQAYSGVPGAQRNLMQICAAQYLPMEMVPTMGSPEGRALSRPQMEIVAARLSALRECFY